MAEDIDSKIDRQIKLEEEMRGMGIARFRQEVQSARDNNLESTTSGVLHIMKHAFDPMVQGIEDWLEKCGSGSPGRRHDCYKWIKDFDPQVMAFLTIKTVMDTVSSGVDFVQVSTAIASQLENEHNFRLFKQESPQHYRKVKADVMKRSKHYRHVSTVLKHRASKDDIELMKFTTVEKHKIGALLLSIMIDTTGLVELYTPPYKKSARSNATRVQPTALTTEWLGEHNDRCELLSPVVLPMIIEPKPWTSPVSGGFWTGFVRTPLVRRASSGYLEDLDNVDMWEVYQALNHMQKTKWKINKDILYIMSVAADNGIPLGNLASGEDIPLPPKPVDIETNKDSRFDWRKKAARIYSENIRHRSKHLSLHKKLRVAERFADEDELYFVYSMDFRGRVYPVQVHLTPQGDDASKSLLHFGDGKEIDNDTAPWLAVHGANLYGFDKVSLQERVDWVIENQEIIQRCAVDPFEEIFWTDADKPWQFLAFCFEWSGFMDHGPGFVSHLPVALDGSCNGLQNFSAMLRDPVGGRATNLTPTEQPCDIYQEVADEVTKRLKETDDPRAAPWIGFVNRKLVKRPTMTMPYGATLMGFKQQLQDELMSWKDEGTETPSFPDGEGFKETLYLAKVIYDSLGSIVVAAREAMDWLQTVARVVASESLPVHWIAPTGFPIMQSYRRSITQRVNTEVAGSFYQTRVMTMDDADIDKRRMAAAIAPNFVHSCDAAHLMRTVNLAEANNIRDLQMVHDSFATHVADTPVMQEVIRHAFVQIHNDNDVLQDFYDRICSQVKDPSKIPLPPRKGSLDITQVMDAEFFFA